MLFAILVFGERCARCCSGLGTKRFEGRAFKSTRILGVEGKRLKGDFGDFVCAVFFLMGGGGMWFVFEEYVIPFPYQYT